MDAAGAKAIDSSILVVLDGKVLRTIREIKDLNSIISPNNIKSINIFKDSVAFTRYGDKGKNGVIEIYSKSAIKSQISELNIEEIKEDENIIFEKAEIDAAFPGGKNQWLIF